MLSETFSHGMIRDFVVAFGTLFNNIKINRRAASGEDSDTIAIPLAYAPQQRYLERITQDPNLDKPVGISLPRMSFELVSMNYSSERKLNTIQRYFGRREDTANTQLASTYSPVPYDFNFQVSVYISNIEDGTHIIEQILPYFTPEFTVSLKSVTELGLNIDLPVVLNSVNMEDNYEGGFEERRVIIWTLDFTMKGQLFGPVSNSGLINKIMINLHTSTNTAIANNYEQVYITPGQFANGLATNSAALSIDPTLIVANSDYGISEQIFDVQNKVDIYKEWIFSDGPTAFDANTSGSGWETWEQGQAANGYVQISTGTGTLKHRTIKTASHPAGNSYSETVSIQVYANTVGTFQPFYGKTHPKVTVKLKTKQSVGSGATMDPVDNILSWITNDSSEGDWADVNRVQAPTSPPYTSGVTSYDTNTQDYVTYEFDLSSNGYWINRIITGLRFEFFAVTDNNGPMEIDTDIIYIKIFANTA